MPAILLAMLLIENFKNTLTVAIHLILHVAFIILHLKSRLVLMEQPIC